MTQPTPSPSPLAPAVAAALRTRCAAADAAPWEDLLRSIQSAQARWRQAIHGLDAAEAARAHDADWTAADVCSHMAQVLQRTTDTLGQVAVAAQPRFAVGEMLLPGGPNFRQVQDRLDRAWDSLDRAARTVAKQRDPGAVIALPFGTFGPRGLLRFLIAHLNDHAAQLTRARAQTSSP